MIDTGIIILVVCILAGVLVWSVVAELTDSIIAILLAMGTGVVLMSTLHVSYGLAFIAPMFVTVILALSKSVRKIWMIPTEHRAEVLNYLLDNPDCTEAMLDMSSREFKEVLIMSESAKEIYYKLYNYDIDAN